MTSFIRNVTDYICINVGFKDDTTNLTKERTAAAALGAISLSAGTYFLKNIITNSHGFPLGSIVGLGIGITFTILSVSIIRKLNEKGAGKDWSTTCYHNQMMPLVQKVQLKKEESLADFRKKNNKIKLT